MEVRTANTMASSTNCSMCKVRDEEIVGEIGSDPATFFKSDMKYRMDMENPIYRQLSQFSPKS